MRAYERLLEYVKVKTPSSEENMETPSSSCQFKLAERLVGEMKELGIEDAAVDGKCYVYGTIPATEGYENSPSLGFIAHMDTVSEFTENPIHPVLHENYDGQNLVFDEGGRVLDTVLFPHLKNLKGRTLITSDGTTILGADDKAGVAEIMTMAERVLTENIPHGQISIGFTPDADFPVIFCEKGTTGIKGGSKVYDKGHIEVEYFGGGIADNVVIPTCKLIVKGDIKVAETEGITVTHENGKTIVEAVGRSAHGSTPHLGVNAAILLLNAVKENEFGGEFQQLMEFLLKEIGTETNGESLGVHYVDEETGETTVNLGIVYYDGEETYFTLDVRYPKNADPKVVDDTLINHINSYTFDVLRKNNHKILYVPKDSELVTKLVHVYEEETGEHLEPLAIGGGTYAKKFQNMVAFGPVFPGEADVIHQPDEHVEVEKLLRALQITAAAMYELAKK